MAMAEPEALWSPPARPLFHRAGVTVLQGDILDVPLRPGSIDLLVTSPPYGVDIQYASSPDDLPYPEYLDFTEAWLRRCWEFAKPDGRACVNIPLDKNKGGHRSLYADVVDRARRAGWQYFSTVVWNEQNISRRTAWGSWRSASAPHVIAPVEMIVLLYKERWEKTTRGRSDIGRQEFIDWTNGVWTFSGETRRRGHPAPFPLELPKRCIKLFSYVGDTVLDPFLGSGTTLVACRALGRRGIGVDVSRRYCEMAMERLAQQVLPSEVAPPPSGVGQRPAR
jgi:site-specific DNA-methyltransferase (adenine-specific)